MTRDQGHAPDGQDRGRAGRVALVCMPFYQTAGPSAAVGLLRAVAEQAGFEVDSYHLNLDLAARLDPALYQALCQHHQHLLCEWLFAIAAFGDDVEPEEDAYLSAFPDIGAFFKKVGRDAADLAELRHHVLPRFIDDCASDIDWGRYGVVGFTSTFQQNVASLALARRIKTRWPDAVIVFGGANMDGEAGAEYVRVFPFVDHAVVGEGEDAFPALLNSVVSGTAGKAIPGKRPGAAGPAGRCGAASPLRDLDGLPIPNYADYFERAERLHLNGREDCAFMLPFEASRGCWWGEKHHCTFCGFNRSAIRYRAKSPERVLDELAELARRHGLTVFSSTDSIMDLDHVEGIFARLRDARTDYLFYWESKANLTREQLRTLHRGGVRILQPGIESLSTHVLRLMRKGSTLLQNIRCLKWARYYGISVGWNLLWGVPGERAEDYRRELEVMRLLTHLDPPHVCGPVQMERDSPYFEDVGKYPISGLRPDRGYGFAYPASVALERIAFSFEAEFGDTVAPEVHTPTLEWVDEWRRRRAPPEPDSLAFRQAPGVLFIDDNRRQRRRTCTFTGDVARIYLECSETMRRPRDIAMALGGESRMSVLPETEIGRVLDEFCRMGLMVADEGWYLGLAIPANPNW